VITINGSNDAPIIDAVGAATVSEEGLLTSNGAISNGNPDTTGNPSDASNSASFVGNYTVSGTDALTVTLTEPSAALTSSGVTITWVGDGTDTLVGSAGGAEIIRLEATDPVAGTGSYTVTLSGPLDHESGNEENLLNIDFGLTVSEGSLTSSSTLTVTVEDDSPVGGDISDNLNVSGSLVTTNLVLVIDTSGSISDQLATAVEALTNLIDSADSAGNVNVQIVEFSSTATSSGWFEDDVQGALDFLNGLTAGGFTEYDAALEEVVAANAAPPTADQSFLYFVSDGVPLNAATNDSVGANVSDGTYDGIAGIAGWEAYAAANFDTVYGIGIPGAELGPLQDVAFPNDNSEENAFLIDDTNDLSATLLTAFAEDSITGTVENVLTAAGSSGFLMGADDGYISEIVVDGISHTYNPLTSVSTTLLVNTALGGALSLNFVTGAYEYSINITPDIIDAQELFTVTATDNDGDSEVISFNLDVNFDAPTDANADNVITNIVDGSTITIPLEALTFNDSTSGNASVVSTDNLTPSDGTVILNGNNLDLTVPVLDLDSSDFTAPAGITQIENEGVTTNNTLETAVDLTDRSLFSFNDDNLKYSKLSI